LTYQNNLNPKVNILIDHFILAMEMVSCDCMADEEQAQDAISGSSEDIKKIIETTCKHSGKSEAEIRKLIGEKQDELSGLVSEEGAAYIVARELGVNLLKAAKRQLKVKNLRLSGYSSQGNGKGRGRAGLYRILSSGMRQE
jgi:hypothetical protein